MGRAWATFTEDGIFADTRDTQTQRTLPNCWTISSPNPHMKTSVLHIFTRNPFPSMLDLQRVEFSYCSSSDSEMMTRSSAYKFSQKFMHNILGRGVPRWIVEVLMQEPCWTGCKQHALCLAPVVLRPGMSPKFMSSMHTYVIESSLY